VTRSQTAPARDKSPYLWVPFPPGDLAATGFTMNREGGDLASTYNWKIDTTNHANDWYFALSVGIIWTQPPAAHVESARDILRWRTK
jgi:hypothetical protein